MLITKHDRIRMERAHVAAWPALRSELIDGWLLRCSGGGSQRANSVSTVDFTGTDIDRAVEVMETRYAACGSTTRFQTFDETSPPELTSCLVARGYVGGETTTTMFKRPQTTEAVAIDARDDEWPGWLNVYLGEITETRREVNTQILRTIPFPRRFFAGSLHGAVISTALCVISHGCAVVECVATHAQFRRRGGGRIVMAALENWAASQGADWLGLQVVTSNASAIALYTPAGFVAGATNRFWTASAAA